jgi:hypothetical protein
MRAKWPGELNLILNNSLMKKIALLCLFILFVTMNLHSQARLAVKTNLPYLVTATPNIGMEYAFAHNYTLELSGGYNPFVFKNDAQLKHWIIWSEVRYWFWESFNSHFLGLHGLIGEFNIGGIDLPLSGFEALKSRRYDGIAKGLGVSYGYQWIIGNNLELELTVGGGFARIDYDVNTLGKNGMKVDEGKKYYFGPTKGALALVYVF